VAGEARGREGRASSRGKSKAGARGGRARAPSARGAATHGIRVEGARLWSFLPNGVFVVSRCIVASVEVVPY